MSALCLDPCLSLHLGHVKGIVLLAASVAPPLSVGSTPEPCHPGSTPCPYGLCRPSEGCEGAPPAFTTSLERWGSRCVCCRYVPLQVEHYHVCGTLQCAAGPVVTATAACPAHAGRAQFPLEVQ